MNGTAGDAQVATSVWLRLLKAHGLLLRELRRRVPAPLTLPQFDVLAQLHRGGAMTPGELTRELLVTAGNLTGIVERLVRMGLVSRHRVPEDGRAVRVQLTPRGRKLMDRAIPRHRRDVAALLSVLPAGELRQLRLLLGTLGEELQAKAEV
jgi:DNA-binding MarR family transcriptional regulator